MPSFGKKLLSAFIEMQDQEPTPAPAPLPLTVSAPPDAGNKFSEHFNRLFAEANLPRPDYYEFSKMTEAMHVIADEKARFCAAFAGLQVQGLNKGKLLSSAMEYQQILEADAVAFRSTIDVALDEKVQRRKKEMDEALTRTQQLSQEILTLQQRMDVLAKEIAENEAKIEHSTAGYAAALAESKNRLLQDIEKIKQYIL